MLRKKTITMRKIIFIGPSGGGGIPTNGASAKNYHLLKYLNAKGYTITVVDTEHWKKNPIILIKLFFLLIFYPSGYYIISTNNISGYKLFKIFNIHKGKKRTLVYWVIGGSIAEWIKDSKVDIKPYRNINWFIVEGRKMKDTLCDCGLNNVIVVPNFKNFSIDIKKTEKANKNFMFLFISRIIPQKGVDMIFKAASSLSSDYRFNIDFYGPVEDSYKEEFFIQIAQHPNTCYKGFIDLRDEENYNKLAQYDVMLFPTFWEGEGFPGVIIDSYIAGLPVIASRWNLNEELIENNKTGWLIEPKDTEALIKTMEYVITHRSEVVNVSNNSLNKADAFRIENVVTSELLSQIGLC